MRTLPSFYDAIVELSSKTSRVLWLAIVIFLIDLNDLTDFHATANANVNGKVNGKVNGNPSSMENQSTGGLIPLPRISLESRGLFPTQNFQETKILSGKRITTTEGSSLAPQNEPRLALAAIPGLVVSEVNNQSYSSLTVRGLGDPHESFNIHTLQNGLPISAEPYGYPAVYFVPPYQALESVEFYRGGAGLLFGPHPGGALNYKLSQAPLNAGQFRNRASSQLGSFGTQSQYFENLWSDGRWGTLISLHGRSSRGFREQNGDYQIIHPRFQLAYQLTPFQSLRWEINSYEGRFGEPGGLSKTEGSPFYHRENRRAVTTPYDQLEIDRLNTSLEWQSQAQSADTKVSLWHTQLQRNSFRQTGSSFGGLATGAGSTLQRQSFTTYGLEARHLHRYSLPGSESALSLLAGVQSSESPFLQYSGSTPADRSGTLSRDILRKTTALYLALENAFRFGDWILTPGARAEEIRQSLKENFGGSLRSAEKTISPVLLGLGLQHQTTETFQTYFNYSQGFKPPAFADTLPLQAGDVVSEDLQAGRTQTYELGLRGQLEELQWDAALFQAEYRDQFGRVGNQIKNVGDSTSQGFDLTVKYRFDTLLELALSYAYLDAKFNRGPQQDKIPQYAPTHLGRTSLTYWYTDRAQMALHSQYTDTHFGDDSNSDPFEIPRYWLFDLSGEFPIPRTRIPSLHLKAVWMVKNLLDERGFARVRANGVEPLTPREYIFGLKAEF